MSFLEKSGLDSFQCIVNAMEKLELTLQETQTYGSQMKVPA